MSSKNMVAWAQHALLILFLLLLYYQIYKKSIENKNIFQYLFLERNLFSYFS